MGENASSPTQVYIIRTPRSGSGVFERARRNLASSIKELLMDVLAVDLGASNGRGIVGRYDENKKSLSLHEVHRFENEPVKLGDYLYWDFPYLFRQIKIALLNAKNEGFDVKSIAVDTWGVDYGLIDKNAQLISNPINYRDDRSTKGLEKLLSMYSKEDLKKRTYMNSESYNTVNQLLFESNIDLGEKMLFMPDLFTYFLSGESVCEYSMASTSQLVDYDNLDWNWKFIDELGLNKKIFTEITKPMQVAGKLKKEIADEIGIEQIDVVSITGHDTHLALNSVPSEADDFLFVATGTWIIIGSKQKKPVYNESLVKFDLSNEGGTYPDVNILKNHVGLWLMQRTKKYFNDRGDDIGFSEMIDLGEKSKLDSLIDIADPRFFGMGKMPELIADYLKETGQEPAETVGDYVRVIERSLAKKIAETIANIETTVDKTYEEVYMFGGGLRDRLLKGFIEEFSGKKIIEGVIEGTATGNVLEQLMSLGVIDDSQRVEIIKGMNL